MLLYRAKRQGTKRRYGSGLRFSLSCSRWVASSRPTPEKSSSLASSFWHVSVSASSQPPSRGGLKNSGCKVRTDNPIHAISLRDWENLKYYCHNIKQWYFLGFVPFAISQENSFILKRTKRQFKWYVSGEKLNFWWKEKNCRGPKWKGPWLLSKNTK